MSSPAGLTPAELLLSPVTGGLLCMLDLQNLDQYSQECAELVQRGS